MHKTLAFALCAAVGAAASAHPFGEQWSSKPAPGPVGGLDAPIEVDEDFESYSVGAAMTSMGGWELWGGAAPDAFISDDFASSGTKSADFSTTGADVVHQFSGLTSGQVTWSTMMYFPTGSVADYFMIALNQYDGGGAGTNWSIQVNFNAEFGDITADCGGCGAFGSIVYDEWVEFRAEVDLDADTYSVFYDDVLLIEDVCWSCGVFPPSGGSVEFAAIDLYTRGGGAVYLDDVLIESSDGDCYPDCDETGTLDFFDFLCFQNAFAAQDPYADCDGGGTHDFFDFLCFQDEFAEGCP